MRTINMTFEDKRFDDLKAAKDKYEKKTGVLISWENYIYLKVMGK